MAETHEKITHSVNEMISDALLKLHFYGEFCQFINFKQSEIISTCGVRVEIQGMQFVYNPKFVDTITQGEMNFIMIHEIFHLLWEHQARTRRLGYDKQLSNMVQDMIINHVIKTDIIDAMEIRNKRENRNMHFAEVPVDRETKEMWVLHLPEEYKGPLIYEDLYEWIVKEKEKYDKWKSECKCKGKNCKCNKKDKSKPEEKCNCKPCPVSDYLKKLFEQCEMGILEWLDAHLPDDIPEDYRKSILENIKKNLRERGILKGDIEETLNKLTRSKKDYIKNIKIGVNELFGTYKNKSITKRNRRGIQGVKGKRKEAYALNVILDVSGSMYGYLEKVLAYVFQNDIKLNVVQCDTEVERYIVCNSKRELSKMGVKGFGGTTLQPAINFITETKEIKNLNTLILTDGYCEEELNTAHLNKVLIISCGKKVKGSSNVKNILIKE